MHITKSCHVNVIARKYICKFKIVKNTDTVKLHSIFYIILCTRTNPAPEFFPAAHKSLTNSQIFCALQKHQIAIISRDQLPSRKERTS